MKIHTRFPGGNIVVTEIGKDVVRLERDIRDTEDDWFYWAFCAEDTADLAGRTPAAKTNRR